MGILVAVRAEAPATSWSPGRRLAFRFAFLYLLLYNLESVLAYLPLLNAVGSGLSHVWHWLVPAVAEHVLHLPDGITVFPNGSGDTTYNYVQLLIMVGMAGFGAGAWTLADRQEAHESLWDGLRVVIRYALATAMLGYGFAKLFPSQFSPLDLTDLVQTYGRSSPMGLLWRFLGASQPYVVFSGALEVIGGLLLFWRRTTTLGALILVPVLANVVAMNVCYDVPVKLYSSHLLLMAGFLLLPDLDRLLDVVIRQRPTYPALLDPPAGSWLRWRWTGQVKALLVLWLITMNAFSGWGTYVRYRDDGKRHPLYGIYRVERVAVGSTPLPPALRDTAQWERLIVEADGTSCLQFRSGSLVYSPRPVDWPHRALTVRALTGTTQTTLHVDRLPHGRLRLSTGDTGKATVIDLTAEPLDQFVLINRGFHWINERPYNR